MSVHAYKQMKMVNDCLQKAKLQTTGIHAFKKTLIMKHLKSETHLVCKSFGVKEVEAIYETGILVGTQSTPYSCKRAHIGRRSYKSVNEGGAHLFECFVYLRKITHVQSGFDAHDSRFPKHCKLFPLLFPKFTDQLICTIHPRLLHARKGSLQCIN